MLACEISQQAKLSTMCLKTDFHKSVVDTSNQPHPSNSHIRLKSNLLFHIAKKKLLNKICGYFLSPVANHSKPGLATVANSFWKPEHTQSADGCLSNFTRLLLNSVPSKEPILMDGYTIWVLILLFLRRAASSVCLTFLMESGGKTVPSFDFFYLRAVVMMYCV